MQRQILPEGANWDQLDASFEWPVPQQLNIAELCCDSWARDDPGRCALIDASDGDRRWSYGALADASNRLAAYMRRQGVGKGDRVALLLPQSAGVLVTHFAAYKLGAVVVPLFSLFGADALRYRLADSGAVMLVTDAAGLEKAAPLLLKTAFLFDWFGSADSGFHMELKGIGLNGQPHTRLFELIARDGDGPYIPCMPSILLALKLANEHEPKNPSASLHPGAQPCLGLISKEEYLAALAHMNIAWNAR